jgi:1,4-dihydroxy-2-naphthoyl-CoA synthase
VHTVTQGGRGLNDEPKKKTFSTDESFLAAVSSYLLPRLLGYSRAVALLLAGGTYKSDSPLLQGLYYATFAKREDVFPAALAFAHELGANTSQTGVAWTKALLWRGADSIEGQHILDSRGIADLGSRGDAAEGARAFMERRPVQFKDVLSKDLSDFVPWVRPLVLIACLYRSSSLMILFKWMELDVRQRKSKL